MTIEEQGSIAGGNLYGLSKAETYFSRPRDLWLRADKNVNTVIYIIPIGKLG